MSETLCVSTQHSILFFISLPSSYGLIYAVNVHYILRTKAQDLRSINYYEYEAFTHLQCSDMVYKDVDQND